LLIQPTGQAVSPVKVSIQINFELFLNRSKNNNGCQQVIEPQWQIRVSWPFNK